MKFRFLIYHYNFFGNNLYVFRENYHIQSFHLLEETHLAKSLFFQNLAVWECIPAQEYCLFEN